MSVLDDVILGKVTNYWFRSYLAFTLKIIRLSIHKNIIHNDDTKDAGPQVQVAEDEYKANILSQKD